jgi:hypothetical protein
MLSIYERDGSEELGCFIHHCLFYLRIYVSFGDRVNRRGVIGSAFFHHTPHKQQQQQQQQQQ